MSTQHFVPSTLPGTGARKINKTSLLSLSVWKARLRKGAELYTDNQGVVSAVKELCPVCSVHRENQPDLILLGEYREKRL